MPHKHVACLVAVAFLAAFLTASANCTRVSAWSNGGYSADPAHPNYSTHDWIAQHALDWLPTQEKQYILDNLAAYLYGTELPDNNNASVPGHIGDTTKHHIYFHANGNLQDGAAAQRASEEYQKALNFLNAKDYTNAAKNAGIMSHYIADVAVFAHVMGASTDWGAETGNNHPNYENYVESRTNSYSDTYNQYLSFDGNLKTISAYDAARDLANDTTFDRGGIYTCTWMNSNYNVSNPTYWNRAGESLNLAVNTLTDVLHTLYISSNTQSTPTPTPTATPTPTPTTAPTQTPTTTASPSLSASTTPTITSTPTQALTATPYSSQNPTPSPTIPEFPVGFPFAVLLLCVVAVAVYLRQKHLRKKPISLRAQHCCFSENIFKNSLFI
jgi:cell division septation protein DedD